MKSFTLKKKYSEPLDVFGAPIKFCSDSDEEKQGNVQQENIHESVVAFDNAQRQPQPDPVKELVIKPVPNRDWRAESLKKEGIYEEKELIVETQTELKSEKCGLFFPERNGEQDENDTKREFKRSKSPPPLTEDELARHALLTKRTLEEERVIEMQNPPTISETQCYRDDVKNRPDEPDLAAYQRVPVEEFGAALLRGMGWKGPDKEEKENAKTEIKQRPPLLGLGAKPIETVEELGAWGQATQKKPTRIEKSYVPLVKVNKKTGEVVEDVPEVREKVRGSGRSENGRSRSRDRTYKDRNKEGGSIYRERNCERDNRGSESYRRDGHDYSRDEMYGEHRYDEDNERDRRDRRDRRGRRDRRDRDYRRNDHSSKKYKSDCDYSSDDRSRFYEHSSQRR